MYITELILFIVIFLGLITELFLNISIQKDRIVLHGNWIYENIIEWITPKIDGIRYFWYSKVLSYGVVVLHSEEDMWGFEEGDIIKIGIGKDQRKAKIIMRYKTNVVLKTYE